jgi:hypothetical protein
LGAAQRRELGFLMLQSKPQDNCAESLANGRVFQLPRKSQALLPGSVCLDPSSEETSQEELAQAYARFQVQMRLDVEHERELLYKSLLVVEVLVFLFVLREFLLRWLA